MPKIFISYRRQDSQITTERIHDKLNQLYGDKNVFLDVADDIPPGSNWEHVLEDNLAASDVLLVIIGQEWEEYINQRVDTQDFVRFEIEHGLKRGSTMLVIPVLVNDAAFPQNIPNALQDLLNHQLMRVRANPDFHSDMQKLIKAINSTSKSSFNRVGLLGGLLIVIALIVGVFRMQANSLEPDMTIATDNDTSVQLSDVSTQSSRFAFQTEFDDMRAFDAFSIEPNRNLDITLDTIDGDTVAIMNNMTDGWYALVINNLQGRNVILEARVRIEAFNSSYADVFFLLRGDSSQNEYQGWVNIRNRAGIEFWNGEDTTELDFGEIEGTFSDWHIVRFEAIENRIQLFVDDDLIASHEDDYDEGGRIGIQISPRVIAYWDYLTVEVLDD